MVTLLEGGHFLVKGKDLVKEGDNNSAVLKEAGIAESELDSSKARKNTIAYSILTSHNTSGDDNDLKLKFDSLTSHDITFVGIIQTCRASGFKKFPVPYVLTNCHNSLCAVGGTINEDDHMFGLTAAKKYGGIYVPAHQAVIHQYNREMMAGCRKMILGSDSHTRYGALGTMAIGEGGPELVKQILEDTYDVKYPGVICVYLEGTPRRGVGPQDVALAIIGAVFKKGFVKNKVMEFVGEGVNNLTVEYRNGIDVMTTETTCLSSIWRTDEKVKEYLALHGRENDYDSLEPGDVAYYDGVIKVDLSKVEPMIALPFHPSNAYTIKEFKANITDILRETEKQCTKEVNNANIDVTLLDKVVNGNLKIDQGVVAGCSGGTIENIGEVADILAGRKGNDKMTFSVYASSQPVNINMVKQGITAELMEKGVVIRSAFCGPCFGAGDVPSNNAFSIRHTTRNFINREGSKPGEGQLSYVALMDSRSIAATYINGGVLTSAMDIDYTPTKRSYSFNRDSYDATVYSGYKNAQPDTELKLGPNIKDWPQMPALTENILLYAASVLTDPVTTTDELIPSGDTSSFRSNPVRLSQYTLSRKDPEYLERANKAKKMFDDFTAGKVDPEVEKIFTLLEGKGIIKKADLTGTTGIGSFIYANKPGDGSAREQAASCQKVLGGWANVAIEYATKRYKSNLINWGILPFTISEKNVNFTPGDFLFIPGIKEKVEKQEEQVTGYLISGEKIEEISLNLEELSSLQREIILLGNLINHNKMRISK